MHEPGEVTRLLQAYGQGDRGAFDRVFPMIYPDLRRIARKQLGRAGDAHTLGPTGVVHEAFLKLARAAHLGLQDRRHFLLVAARAMRQVILSHARRHAAAKRGGDARSVTLDEDRIAVRDHAAQLLELDRALERLARRDERLVRVVECRYFAGLSEEETAQALGTSLRTVQRDWMRARAWLREDLRGGGAGSRQERT